MFSWRIRKLYIGYPPGVWVSSFLLLFFFFVSPWKHILWVLCKALLMNTHNTYIHGKIRKTSGPSCSKLTMSLVNDSLKFTSSDTQIRWNFLLKKMWVAFAVQKLLTFFSVKNIRILYIESAKTVNQMTLNELIKLTMLWTNGPCTFLMKKSIIWSYGIHHFRTQEKLILETN